MRPGRMLAHSPRACPVGDEPPLGIRQVKGKHRRLARARRARPRVCLRKGCGRNYQPRAWNQRYCQEPQCRREVRRWQAARRQAKRRQNPEVKAQRAQAERARRQRVKTASQAGPEPQLTSSRGHAADDFFPRPYATGPAATTRRRIRPAIRRATVRPPVERRSTTFVIENASGVHVALWLVGRNEPSSINPPAGATSSRSVIRVSALHRGHRPTKCSATPRRSSIIASVTKG
jgi:hypothetical protein